MQALPLACSSLTWCPLLERPRLTLAPFLHSRKSAEFITKQGLNRALHAVVTQVIFAEWMKERMNESCLFSPTYEDESWFIVQMTVCWLPYHQGNCPPVLRKQGSHCLEVDGLSYCHGGHGDFRSLRLLRTQQPSLLRSMLLRHQAMSIFFHPVRPKKRAPSRGQHCQVKVEVNAKQDRSANLGKEGGGSWLLCQH